MSGDSSTTINSGSGGDAIYDELLGSGAKMPAAKIHTGAVGVDGGPVTSSNPFPTRDYDGTNPIFPNAAAPADAESASTLMSRIGSYLFGANGTPTWDRLRAGVTSIGSTFTGYLNTLPIGIYHSTRTTRTNGQGGPLETNSQGDLTFQGAPLSVFSYSTLAVNGVQVYSGACIGFVVFNINTTGSADFAQVFDVTSTQSNGTVPLQTSASTATNNFSLSTLGSAFYGLKFSNGIWLQPSTTLATLTKLASSTANAGYVLYLPI